MSLVAIPMMSIAPNQIYRYTMWEGGNRRHKSKQTSLNNLLHNSQVNGLSDKTRKRISKAVNWLVEISDYKWYKPPGVDYEFKVKIAFLTVTLPAMQRHCDKVITKECLNQYLIELRKYHGVKNYVWKAEAQENGNLHYHIAIDNPVDYDKARGRWNRIVEKLGYLTEFEKINGHRDPNSTDIHKTKDVKNLAAYLSSYMSKKESRRPICGRDWGCSQTISRCEPVKIIEGSAERGELYHVIKTKRLRTRQMDYGEIIYATFDEWKDSGTFKMSKEYREYVAMAKRDELVSKRVDREKEVEYLPDSDAMIELAVRQIADEIEIHAKQMELFEPTEFVLPFPARLVHHAYPPAASLRSTPAQTAQPPTSLA